MILSIEYKEGAPTSKSCTWCFVFDLNVADEICVISAVKFKEVLITRKKKNILQNLFIRQPLLYTLFNLSEWRTDYNTLDVILLKHSAVKTLNRYFFSIKKASTYFELRLSFVVYLQNRLRQKKIVFCHSIILCKIIFS